MKKQNQSTGPCLVGEHFLLSVMLGMIGERHPEGSPMRARLEAWAKDSIPVIVKAGNASGDLLGEIQRQVVCLGALLSQKEADRDLKERISGIEANKKAVNDALATGNVRKALEARVFYLLKDVRYRDLQHPDVQKLIHLACLAGDESVFKRLGRALSKAPELTGPDDLQVDNLQILLVYFWWRGPQGQMGLCRLTDEALTEFCNLALDRRDLTLDAVRKTRQRLGLEKGPRPWLTKVEKNGEEIVISLKRNHEAGGVRNP